MQLNDYVGTTRLVQPVFYGDREIDGMVLDLAKAAPGTYLVFQKGKLFKSDPTLLLQVSD